MFLMDGGYYYRVKFFLLNKPITNLTGKGFIFILLIKLLLYKKKGLIPVFGTLFA